MESEAQRRRTPSYRPTAEDIAEVLRLAPPDLPWKLEGLCRHRVRAILILTRWSRSWHAADREARRLVARGRFINGVGMPKGWDHNDASVWIASAACPVCDRVFIPRTDSQIYCGDRCADRGQRIRRRQAILPAGPTRCSRCDEIIVDDYNGRAKFCSKRCRKLAGQARQRQIVLADRELQERRCQAPGCNNPVPVTDTRFVYCSVRCRTQVGNAKRDAKRKLNGGNGHASNDDAPLDPRPRTAAELEFAGTPGGAGQDPARVGGD